MSHTTFRTIQCHLGASEDLRKKLESIFTTEPSMNVKTLRAN